MIMKKRFMFFFLLHVVSMSSTIVISLTLSVDMWIRFLLKIILIIDRFLSLSFSPAHRDAVRQILVPI